jgi:RimJ/RimL family protein N-acetyltransferase
MIRAIPCHEEHVKMFTPRALYSGENLFLVEKYLKAPNAASSTLLKDNEILGCCGFVILWKGVAETWTLFSESVAKYGDEFTEKILYMHDFYEKNLELHRVHCYVKSDNEMAVRWAERLRYKKEGSLEGLGSGGEDYFVMARTKKNGGIVWQS